jgi:predicted nucleic acid-binding protein
MNIVIDTSAVLAVIANERHKEQLVSLTRGADLLAPSSLPWEIGNAFSAMFKRGRIALSQALQALSAYQRIPIRLCDVELERAIELSEELDIYAYDAYVIGCAQKHNCPLISLDEGLLDAARRTDVKALEVQI